MDKIESSIILNYSKVLTYFLEKMKSQNIDLQEKAKFKESEAEREGSKNFHRGVVCGLDEVLSILNEIICQEEKKQKESLIDLTLMVKEWVQSFHQSPYKELDMPLNLDFFRYPDEYTHFREHFNFLKEENLERRARLEKEYSYYRDYFREHPELTLTEEPESIE